MISKESTSREWIDEIHHFKNTNHILVEKTIRVLMLLEGLVESDLYFVFKGGTSLVLLFNSTKRLSIDIDIIVPDKHKNIEDILPELCEKKEFLRYERIDRSPTSSIVKEHYKLYFMSAMSETEDSVLLDVLKEEIHYSEVIKMPISNDFLKENGNPVTVLIPNFNNILGDKLTAFAPNTTGIPYQKGIKEMGMEIIKQMYDIGCLFDKADDMKSVSDVFFSFAETELKYRGNKKTIDDVLEDIIETSLAICLEENYKNADYAILNNGMTSIKTYIFSEKFHKEKAKIAASKAAYLAFLIQHKIFKIERYDPTIDMKKWRISGAKGEELTRLKRVSAEAFYYIFKIFENKSSLS
jgi:Domain of unknown function (DUF1814).